MTDQIVNKNDFSSARKIMAIMVTTTICLISAYAAVRWQGEAMTLIALFLQGWMTILTLYFVQKKRPEDKS